MRVLLALALGLGAQSAAAKPKVVVFPVVPLPGEVETGPAQQMTRAIMAELKQAEALEAVPGEEPASAVVAPDSGRRPARSDADYRAALADLKEGATQAQKLRFPQAVKALRRGIDGLVANLDFVEDYNQLIDAYVLLAVSYFRRGKQPAGTDVLETLARLRPEYALEVGKYPPVFTSIYDDARRRALARPRGVLRVTSAPEGAEVILNGRALGTTPLVVEQVVPGSHHLVVRVKESGWGKVVEVREGATTEQHADLGAGGPKAGVTMGDAIAANRFDREVRKTARNAAKAANADFVLVAAMGAGEGMFTVQSYLGNAKNGRWVALPPLSPDLDMLSDTIEAHTLARELNKQLGSFSGTIGEEDLPFLTGKPTRSGKRGGGLKEARVVFVAADLSVAAAVAQRAPVGGGERAPVSAGAKPAAPVPESAAAVAPAAVVPLDGEPDTSAGGRRPIGAGARAPVGAAASPEARATVTAKEPAQVPLTRTSGGPVAPPTPPPREEKKPAEPAKVVKAPAGPVVTAAAGIEKPEEPAPSERAIEESTAAAAVAAVAVDAAGVGPLAQPSLEAEARWAGDVPIWQEWWFWTAIGGAVLVAGGTTAFLLLRGGEADSVTIRAVW